MKNNKYLLFYMLIFLLMSSSLLKLCYSQSDDINEFVRKGIKLHDAGNYKGAIAAYKEALKIDKDNPLVNYEIAFSYYCWKDYNNAIDYCSKVLKTGSKYKKSAYNIMGSSLDDSGKPDEAIKIYKKGIKEYPNSYLLYFNLSSTCFKQKDYEQAEASAKNAIILNPFHASSHLMLANVMNEKGKQIQCVLPVYFFLMLEPDSKRSKIAMRLLNYQYQKCIKKKPNNDIDVIVTPDKNESLNMANIMFSTISASMMTEKNKDKAEYEKFKEKTTGLLTMLHEIKDKFTGNWWNFYIAFYSKIVESGHIEAFSYYVQYNSDSREVKKWMQSNKSKVNELLNMAKKYKF